MCSDHANELHQLHTQLMTELKSLQLQHTHSPLYIQVVDDDPTTQKLLQRLLAPSYCVTISTTIEQALLDYLRVKPDLVFLDVDLGDPEFNGFDVAHTLCMYDSGANIVMLTAHETAQNIAHATRAGASGFMAKPFSPSRLLHYVQECARNKFSNGGSAWN